MKLRPAMISLAVILAAGCDTMENDVDAKVAVNNEPIYFLSDGGFIDLSSRIVAPGKITVEITTSTSKGELKDLGKGLLQYAPFKGSTNDFFKLRVLSDNNKVLADDSIGIIIPKDTTHLPCNKVYTRNDSVSNVTGTVIIDVSANDYSCKSPVELSIEIAPQHGSATIVNGKVRYEPNQTFNGGDQFMYRSIVAGHKNSAGFGIVWITGSDSTSNCKTMAVDDLFTKAASDTTSTPLDVLANDTICDSTANVSITTAPRLGTAYYDSRVRRIWYRGTTVAGTYDTLRYMVCGTGGCGTARAIIKRN